MRFDAYLIEKKGRSKPILQDKFEKLLNQYCSAALKSTPIYRGIPNASKHLLYIDPSKSIRKSAYAQGNIYTLLMSNRPNWSAYPPRNKSLACSTDILKAKEYGITPNDKTLFFRVYPYDGAKIGVASNYDIWQSFNSGLGSGYLLKDFNEIIDYWMKKLIYEVSGKNVTYEKLLKKINELDEEFKRRQSAIDGKNDRYIGFEGQPLLGDKFSERFFQNIGYLTKTKNTRLTGKSLIDCLDKGLDPKKNGFQVVTVGAKLPKNREVWTDSKCLLVRSDYEIQ